VREENGSGDAHVESIEGAVVQSDAHGVVPSFQKKTLDSTIARAIRSSVQKPDSAAKKRPGQPRRYGARRRDAILFEATRLATVEGIEGLSIGRLADTVRMSESGLFAHFG
jgi:hypothetical protein